MSAETFAILFLGGILVVGAWAWGMRRYLRRPRQANRRRKPRHHPREIPETIYQAIYAERDAAPQPDRMLLRCAKEPFPGATLELGAPIVIGRDPTAAHLVVPLDDVSPAHLRVSAKPGTVILEVLAAGQHAFALRAGGASWEPLQPGVALELRAGDAFAIAGGKAEFQVLSRPVLRRS